MFQQDSKICPRCRHTNNAKDNYCGNCGIVFTGNRNNTATILGEGNSVGYKSSPRFTLLSLLLNRRTVLLTMLLLIIVGVFIFGINTAPPTPIIISLNATQDLPGQDAHTLLHAGNRLTIKASGQVWFGPSIKDDTLCNNGPVDPDGVKIMNGRPCRNNLCEPCTYPFAPVGMLLARISQEGNSPIKGWFVVGSNYSVTAWTSGELYLITNDEPGKYYDNRGQFQVAITIVQS